MRSTITSQKTYTATATVEYKEFGFHATSLTGNLNFTVRIHRPVDTSHSLREQSCEPITNKSTQQLTLKQNLNEMQRHDNKHIALCTQFSGTYINMSLTSVLFNARQITIAKPGV